MEIFTLILNTSNEYRWKIHLIFHAPTILFSLELQKQTYLIKKHDLAKFFLLYSQVRSFNLPFDISKQQPAAPAVSCTYFSTSTKTQMHANKKTLNKER